MRPLLGLTTAVCFYTCQPECCQHPCQCGSACVKASPRALWARFHRMRRTGASMRVRDDPEFVAWLESVGPGDGTAPHVTVDRTGAPLPPHPDQDSRRPAGPRVAPTPSSCPPPSLAARVAVWRPSGPLCSLDPDTAVRSCIVCRPHNDTVDAHNAAVLQTLDPDRPPVHLACESLPVPAQSARGVEWSLASD